MARVLVAMSGGVDSAVAAARLVDEGHDVTGVHLKLADLRVHEQLPGQGCCTLDDAMDARRAAQVLGVPFYVWDLAREFRAAVQDPFAAAYASGRTPNPCVTCNERVKYRALLDRARRLGFDALATGHHARLRGGRDGAVRLLRSADARKDQSYVLYMARPEELAHTLLPIGELTKAEVRRDAQARGLRVADKPDSHDVCFIPDGDTAGYLRDRLPRVQGDIVDLDGTVLGRHDGVWGFTVGQRRGLGLDHHRRRFVVDVDAATNRVTVGPREALRCGRLDLAEVSWTRGRPPEGPLLVQVRAHGRALPGRLEPAADPGSGAARVRLEEPVLGAARGQAAVLYTGQECRGGGTIVAAERAPAGASP